MFVHVTLAVRSADAALHRVENVSRVDVSFRNNRAGIELIHVNHFGEHGKCKRNVFTASVAGAAQRQTRGPAVDIFVAHLGVGRAAAAGDQY